MTGEGGSGGWTDDFHRVSLETKAVRYGPWCWAGYWSYLADGDGGRLWMAAGIRMTRKRALRSARREYAISARPSDLDGLREMKTTARNDIARRILARARALEADMDGDPGLAADPMVAGEVEGLWAAVRIADPETWRVARGEAEAADCG